MPDRLHDLIGWPMWAVGTAASWFTPEKIAPTGIAVAGLIVVVSKPAITAYRDWRTVRREQREADLKLEIELSRELAGTRHEELIGKVQQLEAKVDQLKQLGCANADCPHRLRPPGSSDGIPVAEPAEANHADEPGKGQDAG